MAFKVEDSGAQAGGQEPPPVPVQRTTAVIVKTGDDIRQDVLALQVGGGLLLVLSLLQGQTV